MLPKLICLCGLQGSGKSTFAACLKDEIEKMTYTTNPSQKCIIVSSDQIRAENPNIADDNTKVFNRVYADINQSLKHGDCVIFDATNTTLKSRRQIFQRVIVPCSKICYIVNTPIQECIKRVQLRNERKGAHKVPIRVLEDYFRSFEIPFYEEGWDEIILINQISYEDSSRFLKHQLDMTIGFDQKNKHHTQDLGQHLMTTEKAAHDLGMNVYAIQAAKYHDVGKLSTQTFGEDGQAHYYNHANVGAYRLMTRSAWYDVNIPDIHNKVYNQYATLKWLFYINYHMHMYNIKTEKSINKWKNIFGEKLFNELVTFNKADLTSHANIEESK